jgi:hypothetical protein
VKAIFIAIFIAVQLPCSGCGYHLGRLPSAETALTVGEIHVSSPEPEMEAALGRALGVALSRRTKGETGAPVDLHLMQSTLIPTGPGGRHFQLQMHLRLQSANGQMGTARGSRIFLGGQDALTQARARKLAVEELGGQLVELALLELLSPEDKE